MARDLDRYRFSARVLERFRAGPMAQGVLVKAAKADAPAEILVYDVIGADFWSGDGVTAKGVLGALADADGGKVRVRINSPGGDVFEGLAIYNALRNYAGGVEVVVDGLAASAASLIAMAGGKVSMSEGAMLMIHNAWTVVAGDRNDMMAQAATLGKIDSQIAGIYQSFSGKEGWSSAMDAETYYTADEAVAAGLATDVIAGPKRPKAQADAVPPPEPAEPVMAVEDHSARRRRLRFAEST